MTEPPAVSETEARTLLDGWLAAQNRGDFAAYSKLYATRMDGIKRAGPRIRRFDRAGWLGDRARMFEPPAFGSPMRVDVAETMIQVGPSFSTGVSLGGLAGFEYGKTVSCTATVGSCTPAEDGSKLLSLVGAALF